MHCYISEIHHLLFQPEASKISAKNNVSAFVGIYNLIFRCFYNQQDSRNYIKREVISQFIQLITAILAQRN